MTEMDRPIGVGLIGYGFAGKTFHAPLINAVGSLDLKGVVSSDAAKVRADLPDVTVHDDVDALLADASIELVVVATPNETHAPLAAMLLRASKNVVVDKPFALDLAQARELVDLANRSGCLLSVFQNRRWDSDYLTIKSAIEEGLVGDVRHFESRIDRFRPTVRDRWREQAKPGAGIWFDLGPHLVDQALQLFGLPEAVVASLAVQRDGAAVDDWAHVVLHYGQRRVILHAGMLVAGGSPRFVVHGTKGSLVKHAADRQEAQLLAGVRAGEDGWGDDPDALVVHDGTGSFSEQPSKSGDQRRFYFAIAAALAGTSPNPVPPIQALAVMAVLEAARDSAREARLTELALTPEERRQWN